jgi:carbonic anhydrase/acetyltransferase-like protein (isoleucine patch superfamily)
MKYALGDKEVKTAGDDYYIAPGAHVIGDVTLGHNVSIWWNSVLRGDNDPMVIGDGCNVQDGCVLHADPGFPLTLGENVSLGHMVMLHGCTIGNQVLVGMSSTLLDGVVVEDNVVIGAGSLVPPGKKLVSGYLYLGSPVKQVRPLTEDELNYFHYACQNYVKLKNDYLKHDDN